MRSNRRSGVRQHGRNDGSFWLSFSDLMSSLVLIIILVMTCSMGKGCIFSAIPVGCFQGAMTLLARLIRPLMTDAALANLSLIGSILIFCVGVNIAFGKRFRVGNLLPSMAVTVALDLLFTALGIGMI